MARLRVPARSPSSPRRASLCRRRRDGELELAADGRSERGERVVAGDAAPYAALPTAALGAPPWCGSRAGAWRDGDTLCTAARVWDMAAGVPDPCRRSHRGRALWRRARCSWRGALDDAVMSFDLRTPAGLLSVVQTHRAPAVAILLQPGNVGNLVVTGAADGEMKFCDLRNAAKPFRTANAFRRVERRRGGRRERTARREKRPPRARPPRASSLTSLVAHDHAPVIASGTTDRSAPVKLWDLEGNCFGSRASSAKHGRARSERAGSGRRAWRSRTSLCSAPGWRRQRVVGGGRQGRRVGVSPKNPLRRLAF